MTVMVRAGMGSINFGAAAAAGGWFGDPSDEVDFSNVVSGSSTSAQGPMDIGLVEELTVNARSPMPSWLPIAAAAAVAAALALAFAPKRDRVLWAGAAGAGAAAAEWKFGLLQGALGAVAGGGGPRQGASEPPR